MWRRCPQSHGSYSHGLRSYGRRELSEALYTCGGAGAPTFSYDSVRERGSPWHAAAMAVLGSPIVHFI